MQRDARRMTLSRLPFRLPGLLALVWLAGCVPVRPSSAVPIDTSGEERAATSPTALDRIGDSALRGGDPAAAHGFFARALSLAPGDSTAALGLAEADTVQGRTDDAVDTLREASAHASGPRRVAECLALGKLLALDHRPAEAEAAFRAGLAASPRSAPLLTGLGVSLDLQRRFAAAQASYRQAIAIDPDDVETRNDLALSLALSGHPSAALDALQEARQIALTHGASETTLRTIDGNVALVRATQGDLDAARAAGDRAMGSDARGARNDRFYSLLAGAAGANPGSPGASSGLPPTAAADGE